LRSLDNSDRISKLSKSTLVGDARFSIVRKRKAKDGVSQKIPNGTIASHQDQAGMEQGSNARGAGKAIHTHSVCAPAAGGLDFCRQAAGLIVVREGTWLFSTVR
jgi:hypothetical protein